MTFFSRILLATAVIAAMGHWASAHEADQYTYPGDRPFADMGPYLGRYFRAAIDRGVKKTNQQIRAAVQSGRRGEVEQLHSPEAIAHAVNREFPVALFLIESFDQTLTQAETRAHYPGRICAYKLLSGDIRQYVDVPLSPFNAWKCGTVKAFGVYFGTDKLGHFTDMGMHYFDAYFDARRKGASEEVAVHAALRLGTDDPIYSEKGLLGWATAGAYSNADLASNYMGYAFYRNLSEPLMLKGKQRPPMLELDGDYWRVSSRAVQNADFFSLFVCDHLNEALNPSYYLLDGMRKGIRRAIEKRPTDVLERYVDRFGNRHSQEWFRAKTAELSTYYGQYYGHLGDKELMNIADVCFGPPPEKIDGRDSVGRTLLHIAAERGDAAVITKFVDQGADVNAQIRSAESANADWGNTPLHLAVRNGKMEGVQILIFRGANVNAANDRGVTPMHLASHFPQLAQLLISAGANVNARDALGRAPLEYAAADPEDAEARTLAVLLGAGAKMDQRNRAGGTALSSAIAAANLDGAMLLVKSGADVKQGDQFGTTPLHLAARSGDERLVRAMLEAGALATLADDFGCTPLQDAAGSGSVNTVALLLGAGADARTRDAYGSTALHRAGRFGYGEIAEMLLDQGADIYAHTSGGMMAIDEAEQAGADGLVALLRDAAIRSTAVPASAKLSTGNR